MTVSQDYAKSHGRMINKQHIQDTRPAFFLEGEVTTKNSVTSGKDPNNILHTRLRNYHNSNLRGKNSDNDHTRQK